MTRRKKEQDPNTSPGLFVFDPKTDQYFPSDINIGEDWQGPAVDVVQHATRLIETLDIISEHSQLDGLARAWGTNTGHKKLIKKYGSERAALKVVNESRKKLPELAEQAHGMFNAATGYDLLIQSYGIVDDPGEMLATNPAYVEARDEFKTFKREYYGARNKKKLDAFRKQLTEQRSQLLTDRVLWAQSPVDYDLTEESPETQDDTLGTYIRFNVVANDPNAGFYATTHEEKNRALDALNCIASEDKYAFQKRLNEILKHNKWQFINEYCNDHGIEDYAMVPEEVFRAAIKSGTGAVRSIGFLWGDYLEQALGQQGSLETLQEEIATKCMNPRVTLLEEVDMGNIEFAPGAIALLARYHFLKSVVPVDPDKYQQGDMLRTFKDRGEQPYDGKNKTVYDVFTTPNLEDFPEERQFVEDYILGLTVGQSRDLVKEAIADQAKRSEFWKHVVRQTRNHGAAWEAGKQVLDSLDIRHYD